ncbi:signal peptidase I [Myxococcaceae bacterium GXIMD 01537]
MSEPTRSVSRRRRVLAVVLPLLAGPGAGHMLLGRWRCALGWFAAFVVAQVSMLFLGFAGLGLLLAVLVAAMGAGAWLRPSPRGLPRASLAALGVLGWWLMGFTFQVGVRGFLLAAYRVPSGSMEPTLRVGEHFMLDRTRGSLGGPPRVERGDVVVLERPEEPGKPYVKRVVALAGDVVALRGGRLFLGGQPVAREEAGPCSAFPFTHALEGRCEVYAETLGAHRFHVALSEGGGLDFPRESDDGCPPGMRWRAEGCEVKPGAVFVLGDHRSQSVDSRHWGAVPEDGVRGVAVFIYLAPGGGWARLGQRVE